MNGIKDVLNKYITIKRIGEHGKFVVLNTSIANLEKELNKRSEQLPTYDIKELEELVENFKKGNVKIEILLQMIWDRAYVEGMLYERHNNK